MKHTYTIYSTDKESFIQPKKNVVPKTAEHTWEIETDYKICSKKLKLQGHISDITQIEELLNKLLVDIRNIPLVEDK